MPKLIIDNIDIHNKKKNQLLEGYKHCENDYDRIWWLIIRVSRLSRKAREIELSPYGITPAEAGLLIAVHNIGHDATLTRISKFLMKKPQTTFALLSRMEKRGLIKRLKDMEYKNLVRVELTEKGQDGYIQSMNREPARKLLSVLSEQDLNRMRTYLENILEKGFEEITDF
ncbi:MarR family winged helix-turn-helix transcriptional regulator [Chloroflexota bacterium]